MSQGNNKPLLLPPIEVNAYREQTYIRLGTGAGYQWSPLHPYSLIPGYVERRLAGAIDWVIDTTENSKAVFATDYAEKLQELPSLIQLEIDTSLAAFDEVPDFSLATSIKRELNVVKQLIDQRNLALPTLQAEANAFFSADPLGKTRQDFINTIAQRDLDVTPIQEIHDIFPVWAQSYSAAYSARLVAEALSQLNLRAAELHAQHELALAQQAKQEAEGQRLRDEEQRRKAEQEAALTQIKAANTFSALGAVAAARPFVIGTAGVVAEVGASALSLTAAIRGAVTGLLAIAAAGPGALIATFATLTLYAPKLGNADRFAISVPLAELDPSAEQSVQSDAGSTTDLPMRIGSTLNDKQESYFLAATGAAGASPSVRNVTAQWNAETGTYGLTTTDTPARHLTWTPIVTPGNSSTESPQVDPEAPVYPGATVAPIQPQIETFPAIVDLGFDDYIVWFPADSGLKPIYVVFNSTYDGATVTGEYSGRNYNPDQAGGPIQDLEWSSAILSQEGIDRVKLHTNRLAASDANTVMIERLEKILEGKLDITDVDKRYYTHEIRELDRFRALGYSDTETPKQDSPTWNNAHTATLEDYKVRDDISLLYTEEALAAADEQDRNYYQNLLREIQ